MPQIDRRPDCATIDGSAAAVRQRPLFRTLVTLLERIAEDAAREAGVIAWGCPVPAFGDPTAARVATLGLNPSSREFVDKDSVELNGDARRFHTLGSLGLLTWDDADVDHLDLILTSCRDYFASNPYDRWFKRLDTVVSGTGASFYDSASPACHLDLIPYATASKWTELSMRQRSGLLELTSDTLALLLRCSAVRVLILNGRAVVSHFQQATGIVLERTEMLDWSLPRESSHDVRGYAYHGRVNTVSGHPLSHELLVLGFNYNLQSSYGVTSGVIEAIRLWIGVAAIEALKSPVTVTA
ncbi:hypothetical protein BH09GEM1_BH09GEM1_37600 [soil metagenome]